MASIYDIYTGYIEPKDLQGKARNLTIRSASIGDVYNARIRHNEKKILVSFAEAKKVLVCNKTQAESIAEIAGDDYEQWTGVRLTLSPAKTDKGQDTITIKAAPPKEEDKAEAKPAAAQAATTGAPKAQPPAQANARPKAGGEGKF